VRSVSVAFDVARAMDVDLGVYDLSGALVRRLPTRCVAGTNHVLWNGTDDLGREVATGVYYYSVKAEGEAIASGKVTLAK
jgi:flagellar hook assembly protein FlgD